MNDEQQLANILRPESEPDEHYGVNRNNNYRVKLRDEFAGLAMQMRVRDVASFMEGCSRETDRERWAKDAYKMADAMMKARDE